jgi:hypothetical protein
MSQIKRVVNNEIKTLCAKIILAAVTKAVVALLSAKMERNVSVALAAPS